jgi:multiple sugar transport system ATP-binding protein
MARVSFDNVNKVYPDGTHVIHDLSLDIEDGEFMILVGPSGCGKSTALRMVAGLEAITDGSLSIGDQVVNDLSPKERDIAMVFQSYALYPHMTVADNMGFALKLSKVPQSEIDSRVKEAADVLGLTEYLHRKPKALSGGQRQRVAMGRAIVRSPKAFLMDEPLSNLDAKLRVQMRAEIASLQNRLGVTTLYVTHDQVEAMTMGDRVAVLRGGYLQQADAPQNLYDHPDNLFVASFIGSPSMNIAEVGVVHEDGQFFVQLDPNNKMRIHDAALEAYPRVRDFAGKRVAVGMRPEHFFPADGDTPPDRIWSQVRVELVEMLGSEMLVHVGSGASPVISDDMREAVDDDDAFAALQEQARAGGLTLVARFAPGKPPSIDSAIDVGFKTENMHFFELEGGRALR